MQADVFAPSQLDAIVAMMTKGLRFWTLAEIKNELDLKGIKASEAGISARLREARSKGHQLDTARRSGNTFHYRLWPRPIA